MRDAARGIIAILAAPAEKVRNEVFNVGATDQNYTKKMLVDFLQPYAPDAVVEFVHKEEDPRDYRVSFAKIESVVGFRCTRSVESGVREVARLVDSGIIKNYDEPRFRN